MLIKRTRSHPRDQRHMTNLMSDAISESYYHSDIFSHNNKNNSFFNVPGVFVGFNHRNSESDSVRSPTSPLDFRIFSSFGNPFRYRTKSQNDGHIKRWDCSKVGLRIIDSLDNESKELGKATQSFDNKNIVFGRQISIRDPSLEAPKSLPKDVAACRAKPANIQKGKSDVVFEIGGALFEPEPSEIIRARSLDSGKFGLHLTNFGNRKSRLGSGNLVHEGKIDVLGGSLKLGNSVGEKLSSIPLSVHSGTGFIGSIPASEIEFSEDYTCVTTHGPNPKVTHILGDCILECHNDKVTNFFKKSENFEATLEAGGPSDALASYPSMDFLKFCHSCGTKLDGEDIYMYRGEKAFCSYDCRSEEIEIDEEMEKGAKDDDSCEISDEPSSSKEISKSGLFSSS